MKKKINELDFIGGQGSLTKEEEIAISKYFSNKKIKKNKPTNPTSPKSKARQKVTI
ncbi:MAG: hypothetical protein ACYCOO_02295 [Chitinophagaceae bacterium]